MSELPPTNPTPDARAGLDRRFLVERQGKTFALYAGLLDLAHQSGLKSIKTQLIQAPSPENDNCAICYAEVTMQEEEFVQEGKPVVWTIKTFTGLGDASPANVAPMMRQHIIRMAETRAKARALRDATNIGVAALEELGGDDDDSHQSRPTPRQPQPQPPMPPVRQEASSPPPVTMPPRKTTGDNSIAAAVNDPKYQTWHRNIENAKTPAQIHAMMATLDKLSESNQISSLAYTVLQSEASAKEDSLAKGD